MKRKPITVAFRAFCLSLLFVMSAFAAAQAAKPMKLTGRVVDPDGFSLVGVTITIKGTTKGVTTDSEGKYELDVNAEDIVFRCKNILSIIAWKTNVTGLNISKVFDTCPLDANNRSFIHRYHLQIQYTHFF